MFLLTKALFFPDVETAEEDGLLAVGGELSADRLILAYQSGIFPWFMHEGMIFWYSPPERMVLFPHELHISRSMKRLARSGRFRVTANTAFEQVIQLCAEVHERNHGETWINKEFIDAYSRLNRMGLAHSVEIWYQETLAGGIYGLTMGKIFCGESMFSIVPNASKMALIELCRSGRFSLIDCQVETAHLYSMGARKISRQNYLHLLTESLQGVSS